MIRYGDIKPGSLVVWAKTPPQGAVWFANSIKRQAEQYGIMPFQVVKVERLTSQEAIYGAMTNCIITIINNNGYEDSFSGAYFDKADALRVLAKRFTRRKHEEDY